MIIWSVHDTAGRRRADGCTRSAAEGWRQAGIAAVEICGVAPPVEALILDVGGQRAQLYAGTGSADPDPISFSAVVDDLVRAVSGVRRPSSDPASAAAVGSVDAGA